MEPHRLKPIRPGDALSAEQANQVNRLLMRRITGPNVMETWHGWHIKPDPRSDAGTAMRLVKVTGVLSDRLECREVQLVDWREYESFGDTFQAAAWPTQELSDYAGADNIVMPAFKFGEFWVVHLSGDRLLTDYPDDQCEACE